MIQSTIQSINQSIIQSINQTINNVLDVGQLFPGFSVEVKHHHSIK